MKNIEIGTCERCLEKNKKLIISFEGMVCYNCNEEIDMEEDYEEFEDNCK